ncbi:MAG: hypothetical protein AAFQ17_04440, partial [Pseudomonadota bacterium]
MSSMIHAFAGLALVSGAASAQELINNPTFLDVDGDGALGDGWGSFGNAGFNNFFGAPHASLFADNTSNFGGVFQTGISGAENVLYQFDLLDVRIEENLNANLWFGLEYFAGDDSTRLGEDIVSIDTNEFFGDVATGDGLAFSMQGTAVLGTVFVRPIILFDNPFFPGNASNSGQANAFVFATSLTVVPAPGAAGLLSVTAIAAARRRR